jgi:single-strand DNA-binding protein
MINVVVLQGLLARPAQDRVLPSGTRLLSLEVTVSRPDGPADSVPVAWFDAPASAAALDAGVEVVVVGRIRRRFFRAGGLTQSRTEVVASRVARATELKRSRAMMTSAAAAVEDAAAALGGPPAPPTGGPPDGPGPVTAARAARRLRSPSAEVPEMVRPAGSGRSQPSC